MNQGGDKVATALMLQLRKVLKKTVCDLPRFQAMETEGTKQLQSLANILGQRQSVLKVGPECLSWTKEGFPDLQVRLMVKISAEVDAKIENLKQLILPLKNHHDCVSRARTEILRLLQKHGSELDPMTMYQGSPTIPPVQVMLLWIDDLELQLRELYYSRLHYLENILDPEEVSPDKLAELWTQSSELLNTMQDCEEQTRFFLEETG